MTTRWTTSSAAPLPGTLRVSSSSSPKFWRWSIASYVIPLNLPTDSWNANTAQDSEFTSQVVPVDRLYHRQLLARLSDIAIMEKKWNCKIIFPGTEQASDEVTFTGPQWQVPLCVDEFLVSSFPCHAPPSNFMLIRVGNGTRQPPAGADPHPGSGQVPRVS